MGADTLTKLQNASAANGGAGVTVNDVANAIGRSYWQARRRLRGASPVGEIANADDHGRGRKLLVYDVGEAWQALLLWQAGHPAL